jgi:molecular chaperone GrpE
MSQLDPAEKARLLDEFRACLEEWQEEDGLSENVDLRTLLAEMAALKNEVRLQARQFKTALEEVNALSETLRAQNERLQAEVDRAREQAAQTQRQAERALLLGLIDLRDRLQAGADSAVRRRPSFLSRLVPGERRYAKSLGAGLALTLQRVDELLLAHRVRPIPVDGLPLDPTRMRAVGVESLPDTSDGLVVREITRGFLHGGELLRTAEVIVNKRRST